MINLTQERLKQVTWYNKKTGNFRWKIDKGSRAKRKSIAGTTNYYGYTVIHVDGFSYQASRLAFLYIEGYLPENDVDHINRIRNDNRWCNLRHVSRTCNNHNRTIQKNNKTGITGVHLHTSGEKWQATVWSKNKPIYLGYYCDFDEAVKARWEGEKKYSYNTCRKQSTAYLYLKEHNLI